MILDGDITVPPEDLPKFYRAIVSNRGEMINGSRLVYDMEQGSMRFLNMLGNKAFSRVFRAITGQPRQGHAVRNQGACDATTTGRSRAPARSSASSIRSAISISSSEPRD